jgi:hypothetical protein
MVIQKKKRPSVSERQQPSVRVELTREEAVRTLAALRCYSVPRATWNTQDKFVVALYRQAEREAKRA